METEPGMSIDKNGEPSWLTTKTLTSKEAMRIQEECPVRAKPLTARELSLDSIP